MARLAETVGIKTSVPYRQVIKCWIGLHDKTNDFISGGGPFVQRDTESACTATNVNDKSLMLTLFQNLC